jgi:hypothetical protein
MFHEVEGWFASFLQIPDLQTPLASDQWSATFRDLTIQISSSQFRISHLMMSGIGSPPLPIFQSLNPRTLKSDPTIQISPLQLI